MLTNLPIINVEECENLTRFYVRSNDNVFLFGSPGLGKTAIATQSILALGLRCSYINLSVVERPDLMGYPDLKDDGDVVVYKSPHYLPNLKDDKPSCALLLDEIDKTPQENTHPLLELLQTRSINGVRKNIAAIILTGNTMEDLSGSNPLSKALLDRGAKYQLAFDFERWLEWGKRNGVHDLVLGFLKHNPALCNQTITREAMAFPTPRSWTLASNAIYRAKALKLVDIETVSAIVSGFVGEKAGIQFRVWYEHFRRMEAPALSLVMKGIEPAEYSEWSITQQIVFVIAAAQTARLKFIEASKTKPRYQCIERLVGFLERVEPELQGLALSHSFPIEMVADPRYKLYQEPGFFALTQKLSNLR